MTLSPILHALTSLILLTHSHVSSVYKSLGSCMFIHLEYQIRLLLIVYTTPLHDLKHPIEL